MPPIQIMVLYWNGAVWSLIEELTGLEAVNFAVPLNILLVIILAYTLMRNANPYLKMMSGFGFIFFSIGLVLFSYFEFVEMDGVSFNPLVPSGIIFFIGMSLLFIDTYKTLKHAANKK